MRVSIAALGAFVLLVVFIDFFATRAVIVAPPHATSSALATLQSTPLPQVTLPTLTLPTASTQATTTSSSKPKPQTIAAASSTAPTTSGTANKVIEPSQPVGNLGVAADELHLALVNIICYASAGSGLSSISGSGVFIDPKGIILTNAHIGEYFLLANHGVSCTIRTGSPAQDAYEASLIFISPDWLKNNSSVLTESAPTGTGQYDFALLGVTSSATSAPLPSTFPSVPLQSNDPSVDEPVVIGSYAAQFLDASQIASDLSPTIVYGSVKSILTFNVNTTDVIALGGSAAAQEGSSGGGVVDASGLLTGLIVTSTTEGSTAERNLSAITLSYIRRDYIAETGMSINALLSAPVTVSTEAFAPEIPNLESIIQLP